MLSRANELTCKGVNKYVCVFLYINKQKKKGGEKGTKE